MNIELTDQQLTALRIAIAEDQGWRRHPHGGPWWQHDTASRAWHGVDEDNAIPLPNYPADRNAIVEAIVARFTDWVGKARFNEAIRKLLGMWHEPETTFQFALATASPETLCLAYAKAANLNIDLP
jgi:hypothetical protein